MKQNLSKRGVILMTALSLISFCSCQKDLQITNEQGLDKQELNQLDDLQFTSEQTTPDFTSFLTGQAAKLSGNLLIEETFESSANILNGWGFEIAKLNRNSLTYPTNLAKKGTKSARFELNKSDWTNYQWQRAEVATRSETENERWYGFSEYMKSDFVADMVPEIIAQWHGAPDTNLGEVYGSPPISIYVTNDHYYLTIKTSSKAVNATSRGQSFMVDKSFDLGKVVKGQWVDWVFHIKWSWHNDGLVEVYKNKQKVYTYANAPSMCNDKKYPYFKLGIYKWGWTDKATTSKSPESQRVLYVDEIRVGNKNSNLTEVSPR